MAAKARRRRRQSGQSLIEFAFLMPIVFLMIGSLRDIDMAINASIVNTRYARSTMMYLFFNHRWYPEDGYTQLSLGQYMQRWWVGVGNKQVGADPNDPNDKHPEAPLINVGQMRSVGSLAGQDDPGSGPDITRRQKVRIRGTAFTCTPPRGPTATPYSLGGMPDNAFMGSAAIGNYCSTSL